MHSFMVLHFLVIRWFNLIRGQDEIPVCMSGIDLVIASEIFYLVTSQDALIKTLKELAILNSRLMFIMSFKHRDLGEKSLLEKLVAHGFRLEVVSRSEMQKEFELQLEYSIVKLEYKY